LSQNIKHKDLSSDEFIQTNFSQRKLRQKRLLRPALMVLLMAALQGVFAPEWRNITVPMTLLLMPTILLYTFLNWKCPSCKKFLGRINLKIQECPHCKVVLQSPEVK
jgi:hypothetical protein